MQPGGTGQHMLLSTCETHVAAPAEAGGAAAAGGGYEHHEVNRRIGPAAAFYLRMAGVPADAVQPTGPHGIVTKGDVLAAMEAGLKARAHLKRCRSIVRDVLRGRGCRGLRASGRALRVSLSMTESSQTWQADCGHACPSLMEVLRQRHHLGQPGACKPCLHTTPSLYGHTLIERVPAACAAAGAAQGARGGAERGAAPRGAREAAAGGAAARASACA